MILSYKKKKNTQKLVNKYEMATDKFINTVHKRIGRTLFDQQLINDEDKILIALSGGKDSLILLESLSNRKKVLKQDFSLVAAYVKITNIGYETDMEFLKTLCSSHEIPFHILEFKIDLTAKGNNSKSACFLCSWHRRKALFDFAKSNSCNKIAFGHHMDDAIETLFLNMVFHGSISSMPFSFQMLEGSISVIRPMLEIAEDDLLKYASVRGYTKELKNCPFENSKRQEIKLLIAKLKEMNRHAAKNILRSMDNTYPEYLPRWNKKI